MKTRYEQMVESGELLPMNGLDMLVLEYCTEKVLDGSHNTEEDFESMRDVWVEVEYLYHEDTEKLQQLKQILFGHA